MASNERRRSDRWILRIIALVTTLVLWITVHGGKKAQVTKKVPIQINLKNNIAVINQVPKEISVVFEGPRVFLQELNAQNLNFKIDLQEAQVGRDFVYSLNEEMLNIPIGVKVKKISPVNIPLEFDFIIPKKLSVHPVFEQSLPEGFKVKRVILNPNLVEATGPRTRLKRIDSLPTERITLSGSSLNQEYDVSINLKELSGIEVKEQQKLVKVIVELEGFLSKKWYRQIPLGLRLLDGPSRASSRVINLKKSKIKMQPEKINVYMQGPRELIKKLNWTEFEFWAEINTLLPGTYRVPLRWSLPPDLTLLKKSHESITVVIP